MGNLKFGNNAPLALYMGVSGATKAYYGTEVVFGGEPTPIDYSKEYLTFDILTGGTINWTESGSTLGAELSYSLNDGNWTALPTGSTINVSTGDKVRFKGNNPRYSNLYKETAGCTFSGSTASFNLYGNILSLIYGDNFEGQTSVSSSYTFQNMFTTTSVVDASNLVLLATTVLYQSYCRMFYNCASLTAAPALPATTLAQSCYASMFYNCTSLTTAAPVLPATTLANYCYEKMFYGCTSLTAAPELLATTLANYCCYYMFGRCTSLTAAPVLSATVIAQNGYPFMFYGCTNLSSIKCLATDISASNCLSNWLYGVSSSGTFEGYSSAGYPSGNSGIPSGWTFVEAS